MLACLPASRPAAAGNSRSCRLDVTCLQHAWWLSLSPHLCAWQVPVVGGAPIAVTAAPMPGYEALLGRIMYSNDASFNCSENIRCARLRHAVFGERTAACGIQDPTRQRSWKP